MIGSGKTTSIRGVNMPGIFIDKPTARFLQTVAWEAVQDYYQK
jgi:hypothetical protein